MVLSLAMPNLRLEDLVHDLRHCIQRVVTAVHSRLRNLGEATKSSRDIQRLLVLRHLRGDDGIRNTKGHLIRSINPMFVEEIPELVSHFAGGITLW